MLIDRHCETLPRTVQIGRVRDNLLPAVAEEGLRVVILERDRRRGGFGRIRSNNQIVGRWQELDQRQRTGDSQAILSDVAWTFNQCSNVKKK